MMRIKMHLHIIIIIRLDTIKGVNVPERVCEARERKKKDEIVSNSKGIASSFHYQTNPFVSVAKRGFLSSSLYKVNENSVFYIYLSVFGSY